LPPRKESEQECEAFRHANSHGDPPVYPRRAAFAQAGKRLTNQVIVYTITSMEIEFDPAKNAANIKEHGLTLELAAEMEWGEAFVERDDRFHYGEVRFNAIVPMGNRLYFVTFSERSESMRPISLRYANKKEVAKYVQNYR
jgi:uncharacterized DUF497 family protein